MKNELIREIRFLTVNYLLGPMLGVLMCLLEAFGRIKFINFERFPIWERKLIIVANHPSFLEPLILSLIGFPWINFPWLFSPLWSRIKLSLSWFKELQKEFSMPKKLLPANVPLRSFYDPSYLRLFQGINIPIDEKGSAHSRIRTISALKKIMENGGRVLIFPEGTRTFRSIEGSRGRTGNGNQLGELKDGAAWLALRTKAKVLPIWVAGTDKVLPDSRFPLPRLWHRITVKIGTPFMIQGDTREEATLEITRALLELADE